MAVSLRLEASHRPDPYPARTFIYSTGLPPSIVAAALAAFDIIENDPDYAALPLAKARAFTKLVGFAMAHSPIVPLVIGDVQPTLYASGLFEAVFLPPFVRRPCLPPPRGCASHLPRRIPTRQLSAALAWSVPASSAGSRSAPCSSPGPEQMSARPSSPPG